MRSAVQPWIDELTGRAPGAGGSARSAPAYNALAQGLLAGIVRPEIGSPFQAPAIGLAPEPRPPAPNPGERAPSGGNLPFEGIRGGGRDLGGGAKAAGLQKLGAGIESALGDWAAKRKAQQEGAGIVGKIPGNNPVFGQPSSPVSPGATPGQDEPASTPYTPAPVGSVSDVPIFGQPAGQEARGAVPPIGGGGSLPTLAQGVPATDMTQTADRTGGSRSWRNNNPGNIEYGGFAQSHGAIGTDGRFAIFPSEQAGTEAQRALLFNSRAYGNLTLPQAISKWAPASDNNDVASYIRAMGGDNSGRKMSDYSPAEQDSMLQAMRNHEGWRPGIGGAPTSPPLTAPSASAYAAAPPNLTGASSAQLAGAVPTQNTGEPRLISPGQPQTGPTSSDDTWNNRPQYDYGGSAASTDFHPIGGSASDIPDYRNAIATVESRGSGDYGAVNSSTGALGRYQVMPANLAQWTQQALGHPMTPQQFLASPEAQDAVFNNVFGGYVDKYGPSGAAAAWNVGPTAFSRGNTDPGYVAKFNAALDQSSTSSPPLPPTRPADINSTSSPDAGPTNPVSPQSMNDQSQINPLAAALAGYSDPNNPQMAPGIVDALNAQPYGFDALFGYSASPAPTPELGDLFNYG